MTIVDDVRAHIVCDYVRPYENMTGDFANAADVRSAISLATVEIECAEIAAPQARRRGAAMSIIVMLGCLLGGIVIGAVVVPVALGAALYEEDSHDN
jgi:hypothetical protein